MVVLDSEPTHQSPCRRRGFLFLQSPQTAHKLAFNIWHDCPQNSQSVHPSSSPINPQKMQGTANKASAFFSPTSIHIPSTQLPKSSLPIAIADAIGSSKSHRNLMPLLWDLIEPHIKYKRQLLLPWRDTLSIASTAPNQSLQHP